ncbi:methyl-accepting chemotaxis protein [Marinobacter sp. M3C]|jgi:methyl-accepting chemotaxis protein|uniref:methyl-accepting chemotaxis protein n=1 Tax=unclassified Marinobacter TaxID=83889 RepID=UPI00200DE4ED|nr:MULTISPECIES: methyl-accepting chemotaxis protein [unclassified Marinobacter]MCL1482566.1 methyl-accepting chemotaxis protein [Marinobacter sp.]MCL1486465.1 methyl-accepting chemotaxis protein [Marinobacter sp.]MCL1488349.1 methyl-accepting chemotaxis protein [Marinobacter sp.]UQG57048.1 methyl-accepting chemotaxis protein [Marinobacter sp. M4C]UQG61756.1 methyl-accepting chemotaxis protein [Marinobacter sp. M3C]
MKKLSLKFKLYVFVISLLLVMGVSMVITAQVSLSQMEGRLVSETSQLVQRIVMDRLSATAGEYGEEISGQLNAALKVPDVVGSIIEENIAAGSSSQVSRSGLSDAVRAVLTSEGYLSAMYAQFEPNAYDGLDRYFNDGLDDHSTDIGTLEIYYIRDSKGNVQLERVEDPEEKYDETLNEFGAREAEWYLCPMETKTACIMEPYNYEIAEGYTELMTTLVVPIMNGQEFAGVVGVDINLETLQKTVKAISQQLYDGQSRVTLLSEQGLIVAASHNSDALARPLAEVMPELASEMAGLHRSGGRYDDGETLAVSYPVHITDTGGEWSLLVELPRATALAELDEITTLLSEEVAATAQRQLLVGIIVSILAVLLLIVVVRSVVRPLDEIRDRMNNLSSADGDLTRELDIDTHAELIDLAGGFNTFLRRLRDMINDLKAVNVRVHQQAADVGTIARDTEENTARQHREVDGVVTAMNEMSAAAGEVAGFASESAENARKAQDGIRFTQSTLGSAVEGVSALAGDMVEASEAIGHVASRSDEINRILDVIRGVAEQTNLLALNAAIEAARAGEQGRGFAVVADEVRTLASRTRQSTDEISQMIDGLQQDVKQAVGVINAGVDRATMAVEGTREADHSLATVVTRIDTIVEHVIQVATAAEEQNSVSEEINHNLTAIGDAASDLRELAQRLRGSGESLDNEVEILDGELNRLKT